MTPKEWAFYTFHSEWDALDEQRARHAERKRLAEIVGLATGTPESRERLLRWAWDQPEEPRDAETAFWQEDRYFHFRPVTPKPDELPAHWTPENGPWARKRNRAGG